MDGVGEVVDLDPDLGELLFEEIPLGGAPPVVALEEVREPQLAPCIELLGGGLDVNLVHEADVADDLGALRGGDDGLDALDLTEHLVADHAGDQEVAVLPGVAEHIQMTHMEEVERPWCVSDSHTDLPVHPVDVAEAPNSWLKSTRQTSQREQSGHNGSGTTPDPARSGAERRPPGQAGRAGTTWVRRGIPIGRARRRTAPRVLA